MFSSSFSIIVGAPFAHRVFWQIRRPQARLAGPSPPRCFLIMARPLMIAGQLCTRRLHKLCIRPGIGKRACI